MYSQPESEYDRYRLMCDVFDVMYFIQDVRQHSIRACTDHKLCT